MTDPRPARVRRIEIQLDDLGRRFRKELRDFKASLTPEQLRPLREYLSGRLDLGPSHVQTIEAFFLMALQDHGREYGLEWLEKKRADEAAAAARVRLREEAIARETEEREAKRSHRRQEIQEAIAAGGPVPAHLRPAGGRCALCSKSLRDPLSVRLGVGPECRRPR